MAHNHRTPPANTSDTQETPVRCRILGPDWEYTDEYENEDGYVQADRVCQRCGRRELAWTGPNVDELRAIGFDIPNEPTTP